MHRIPRLKDRVACGLMESLTASSVIYGVIGPLVLSPLLHMSMSHGRVSLTGVRFKRATLSATLGWTFRHGVSTAQPAVLL